MLARRGGGAIGGMSEYEGGECADADMHEHMEGNNETLVTAYGAIGANV